MRPGVCGHKESTILTSVRLVELGFRIRGSNFEPVQDLSNRPLRSFLKAYDGIPKTHAAQGTSDGLASADALPQYIPSDDCETLTWF